MDVIREPELVLGRLSHKKLFMDRSDLWVPVFERLNMMADKNTLDGFHSVSKACSVGNVQRNLFPSAVPYDENRVKIGRSAKNKSGYINASTVLFKELDRQYILASLPPSSEHEHFWQMVLEQRVPGIVIFSVFFEFRPGPLKMYYPQLKDDMIMYGRYEVLCEECEHEPTYIYRKLTVKYGSVKHSLLHFEYTGDSENSYEDNAQDFVRFHSTVRYHGLLRPLPKTVKDGSFRRFKPTVRSEALVVQCSNGVGRSAVFIVLDVISQMLRMEMAGNYSVEETILGLRSQRRLSVRTVSNYRFLYDTIIYLIGKTFPSMKHIPESVEEYVNSIPVVRASVENAIKFLESDDSVLNEAKREEYIEKKEQRTRFYWDRPYRSLLSLT